MKNALEQVVTQSNKVGLQLYCFQKMLQALEIAAQASVETRQTFDVHSVLTGLRIQLTDIENNHDELETMLRGMP